MKWSVSPNPPPFPYTKPAIEWKMNKQFQKFQDSEIQQSNCIRINSTFIIIRRLQYYYNNI